MNNKQRKRNFTPSDDTLIREQPVTGIGLKTLETMLRVTETRLCVGPTNLALRWLSVIMTRLSTRERSAAPMDSSTRYWNG